MIDLIDSDKSLLRHIEKQPKNELKLCIFVWSCFRRCTNVGRNIFLNVLVVVCLRPAEKATQVDLFYSKKKQTELEIFPFRNLWRTPRHINHRRGVRSACVYHTDREEAEGGGVGVCVLGVSDPEKCWTINVPSEFTVSLWAKRLPFSCFSSNQSHFFAVQLGGPGWVAMIARILFTIRKVMEEKT